jgi:predicted Zn-dependent protease
MFRARVLLPLVLFGLYGAYYYFSNRQTVPLTGRKHMVDMSTEQEAALGFQSYRQILAKSQVVQGGKVVDLVRDIGRKIAAVSEDPGFKWEFNVIQSQQVNAFCLPGGKVAVYTGILPVAKNSLTPLRGMARSGWLRRSWCASGRLRPRSRSAT